MNESPSPQPADRSPVPDQPSAARPAWQQRIPAIAAGIVALLLVVAVPSDWLYDAPTAGDGAAEQVLYACPMHPQITSYDASATCPECGMDLEVVRGSNVLTPADQQMIGLSTVAVRALPLTHELRTLGHLQPNETRISQIAAYAPGRVEVLHADVIGQQVEAGEPLLELFSPQLYTAQQEFVTNLRSAERATGSIRADLDAVVAASRERLRQLGLSAAQINDLAESRTPTSTITIPSPRSGTVTARAINEGEYVREGSPLLTIADLRSLWLYIDVAERHLPMIRIGQRVEVETEANPNYTGRGWIDFIEPSINPRSRTARVRVTLPNPSLPPNSMPVRTGGNLSDLPANRRYLPGMFATVRLPIIVNEELRPALTAAGDPVAPADAPRLRALPAEAILQAGDRAVVYILSSETEDGLLFELREVTVGPLMHNAADAADRQRYRAVLSGLSVGDVVANKGAFLLDSQAQIRGNPSLYFPLGQGNENAHAEEESGPAADPHAGHNH